MRILLIGNYPPDRQQSMLRFASLMERELNALGHQATLLQPKPVLTARLTGSGAAGKWLGYIDKFLIFPRTLKRTIQQPTDRRFDLVHICDHSNAMYAKYLIGVPNVITCHDVLAIKCALGEIPGHEVSFTGRKLQAMILAGLKKIQYIVCDSAITQSEMLRITDRLPQASEVVYLSLAYPYIQMARDLAIVRLDALGFDARTPFFLHVGGNGWNKNRLGVLEIFRLLRARQDFQSYRLLFMGDPPEPAMVEYIAAHDLGTHTFHLSNLSNEDLCALYSVAEALLYPSLEEGFGWPVIEAQSCGCPVFASARAPMTELGGDSAVYFDPENLPEAAKIIATALERRDSIREAGLVNVQRFSVAHLIDGYLKAYERISANASTNP